MRRAAGGDAQPAPQPGHRQLDGEDVDPAEMNPPPYCEPGEYDRLRNRWHQLHDLPDPDVWDSAPRPAQPGEADALGRRYEKLENTDLSDGYPSGFTARLNLPAVEQARQDLAAAVERAEAKCQAINAWWEEHDRLEDAGDPEALAAYQGSEPEWGLRGLHRRAGTWRVA